MSENYLTVKYNNQIEVCYTPEIDGGGNKFGQDYIPFIRQNFGKVDTIFEWCSGPAFIGFSLLAHNLCERLSLADINPKAVAACEETIRRNKLEDRVVVRLSDSLDQIPRGEKWDIVVSNPPHSPTDEHLPGCGTDLIYKDVGWSNHKRFYAQVTDFLSAKGAVVIQENGELSKLEDFTEMIREAKLKVVYSKPCASAPRKYYIWSIREEGAHV